jgi:glutamate formiminotransferase
MNLLDVEVTGVREAFDAVTRAASARGMEVLDSEIVGLAPAAALPEGTMEHVRLAGFSPDEQILEELVESG